MNYKTLTSAALAAVAALSSPVEAYSRADFEAHQRLYSAVESLGVDIFVNPPEVCDDDDAPMGFYSGSHSILSLIHI